MLRVLYAVLLAAAFSNVAEADDMPDDTQVRAMTIFPNDAITISKGIATLKECREAVAEMMDQLKAEDDARGDGMVYACIPADLGSGDLMRLEASRYKRNMFKQ